MNKIRTIYSFDFFSVLKNEPYLMNYSKVLRNERNSLKNR